MENQFFHYCNIRGLCYFFDIILFFCYHVQSLLGSFFYRRKYLWLQSVLNSKINIKTKLNFFSKIFKINKKNEIFIYDESKEFKNN